MRFRRHKRTFGTFMVAVLLTLVSPVALHMRALGCRLCGLDGDGSCMRWADCTNEGDDGCIQQPFFCGKAHVSVNCGCGSTTCSTGADPGPGPGAGVSCIGRDPNDSIICAYQDLCGT